MLKPAYAAIIAVLAVAIAAIVIFKISTAPTETVNPDPSKIPPKGAGRKGG